MRVKIGIHPAFWLLVLIGFFTETLLRMLGVYLCLLIHEAGHAVVAYSFKARVSYLKIMPFGIAMRLFGRLSPKRQLLVSLAGPFFSLIAGLLFENEFLRVTNIALGILNLLPAKTLDGGSVLCILLTRAAGSIRAYRLVSITTVAVSVVLLAAGGYALFITGFNVSPVLVGVFLIYSLVSGNEYSRATAHFTVLDYRKKTGHKGIFGVKQLAVFRDMPLRKILPQIPAGKLCIINILDSDGGLVTSISEQTAVDIMLTHGANASYASVQKGENT